MLSTPTPSMASGSKSKNEAPNKAPAEKATKAKRILFSHFSLKNKTKTPTKDAKLIKKVERIIKNKVIIIRAISNKFPRKAK